MWINGVAKQCLVNLLVIKLTIGAIRSAPESTDIGR